MSIDLRHLRAFAALGRELHFGRAADGLQLAQPALTKTIKQLEAEVGVPLLVRTTRRVELTEAGKVFLAETTSVAAQIAQAVERARYAARGLRGDLRVAYTDFAINGRLPHFLRDFNSAHGDIRLDLVFMPTVHQRVAILKQTIDVGFLYGESNHRAVKCLNFDAGTYVAVLPANHPLAAKEVLTLSELRDQKFVFGTGDSWSIFRNDVFAECRARGFFPDIALEATNTDGIFGLVIAGAGVAVYSSCIGNLPRQGVAVRPLSDLSTKLPITVVWERSNRSELLDTFLRFLRRWTQRAASGGG
ncbi:LysR substrate-binding domain-containing protein [Methylobacterium sp. NEAU 140]|uniref:LysR family transcriptional regulator n=1 Tax=Methylobacterium sp. NEAU 140 TaxID=3064945 RepID=UPI002734B7F8|nr:LysR substrate-binding domain-containing protein [Methylobacterium sp. NEAU 140]MDP4025368.1 LysR substrate-binding domain-containing protein [Methylobacterium sp. NEAU 140]